MKLKKCLFIIIFLVLGYITYSYYNRPTLFFESFRADKEIFEYEPTLKEFADRHSNESGILICQYRDKKLFYIFGNNVQTKGFTISKNRKLNAIRIDTVIVGKKVSSITDPVFCIQMGKEVPKYIILNDRRITVAEIEKIRVLETK